MPGVAAIVSANCRQGVYAILSRPSCLPVRGYAGSTEMKPSHMLDLPCSILYAGDQAFGYGKSWALGPHIAMED